MSRPDLRTDTTIAQARYSDGSGLNIGYALENVARSQPTAPALHVRGRTSLSYADLGAQIRYVRERLASWDFVRGDVIAGVIPARPEMALACATIPAAATFAPLSAALTPEDYADLLARLRPKLVIVPSGVDHPLRAAAQRCGVAEADLAVDPGAPAGVFTLDLIRQDESMSRAASAHRDLAYVMSTSGTTGRPKLVPISHRRLALYAQNWGDWLQLSANDVGCHLQPMHHGHGLNNALMIPLLRGGSVVCLPENDIDGFFAALDEYRITWLTAVFTVQRALLRRAADFREAVARNRLRFIRVGSGRLEPDEIDRIERTFGAPLLMALIAQETFLITHDPLPPGMRKRGATGVPLCNQVAVMNEAGAICAAGNVGEIVVSGPLVFDGYFNDPQATAAAFVDGWFRTGDLGRFDADGYLYLDGRIKELINRGGEKISPVAFDAAIEAIPGVRAAATFGIPHPTLGEEVAAAVVRDGDVAIEPSDIIDGVRRRMGPSRVPRQIFFVDHLPRTESGKLRRSELSKLLGLNQPNVILTSASRAENPCAMGPPLQAALARLWASVLHVRRVGPDDDFFVLGGDSLSGARLLTRVEAVFGVNFSLRLLFQDAATVSGMARAIEAARSSNGTVDRGHV